MAAGLFPVNPAFANHQRNEERSLSSSDASQGSSASAPVQFDNQLFAELYPFYHTAFVQQTPFDKAIPPFSNDIAFPAYERCTPITAGPETFPLHFETGPKHPDAVLFQSLYGPFIPPTPASQILLTHTQPYVQQNVPTYGNGVQDYDNTFQVYDDPSTMPLELEGGYFRGDGV
jgi:hypothetical protein